MRNSQYTKEEEGYLRKLSQMTESERKEFIKSQAIINENVNIDDIPALDMPIKEYCEKYGYVELHTFFNDITSTMND